MANFLILHGTAASPEANWFMWLKGVLIGEGHKVWLPQLPDADSPNEKTYTKFLLSNDNFTFDEQTIIIGHSSGSVEALHILKHLPDNIVIKAEILVSAFKDDLGWESLRGLFEKPFDFDAIKSHCKEFIYIHSDNDPYVPTAHAKYLATQTRGRLIEFEGEGHFNTEQSTDYRQFPELLDIIQDIL